jgi:hypothetical protein
LLIAISLVSGLLQTLANRFYMGNDGVSYLDIADAYLRGDWQAAINTSWNPLYAWFIALDFLILHPSPFWEYPSVQFVNFGIYCLTVISFEFFLREWLKLTRQDEPAIRVIAYALFLWSSLILIGIWTVNADMLVAASFYGALGCMLRLQRNQRPFIAAALGLILAAAYYGKAVMFPVSIGLLLVTYVVRWRSALVATVVFAALSAPLISVTSKVSGHPTFGDTGRVNYAWYVNGVPSRWWQGGPPRSGNPVHPPAILLDTPRVYGFAGTFPNATYPIWYDFASWYRGLHVWFGPRQELRALRENIKWLLKLIARDGTGFVLGLVGCFIVCRKKQLFFTSFAAQWLAWTTSIAAMLLYCAVHVESRYIGAFLTVLLLSAFGACRPTGNWLASVVVLVGLIWAIVFLPQPTAGAHYLGGIGESRNEWWLAASGLQKMGLHPNDKVSSACYSNRRNVLWARLARAKIVAETDWNFNFWRLSDGDQRRVLSALAQSGAIMAVADQPPPDPARSTGWRQIGNTEFYVYSFAQPSPLVRDDAASRNMSPVQP